MTEHSKHDPPARAVLLVATALAFHHLMLLMTFYGLSPDFPWHNDFVHQMRVSGRIVQPHFLYASIVLAFQAAFERLGAGFDDYRLANYAAAMTSLLAAALAGFAFLRMRVRPGLNAWLLAALAFALLFVDPLWIFGPRDQRMYLGYIAPNSYHNPTVLVLKPLALFTFYFGWRAFEERSRWATVAGAAIVTALGAIAKPSHLIAILPALGLIAIIRFARRQFIDWPLLLGGIAGPAFLVLAAQYAFEYGGSATKILFAPLLAARMVSGHLFPKFLLSIAFPAAVCILYARTALRDVGMQLAGATFLFASAYGYLLAESGREFHGNFGWGSQVALWILFAAALVHMTRNTAPRPAVIASWILFWLHALSGVAYIVVMFLRKAANPLGRGLYR